MGYGQGDYGQGDYGQGDPGLFSFIGKALKTVAGFIPGVGDAVQAVSGLFHHSSAGGGTVASAVPVSSFGPSVDVGYGLFHRGPEGTTIAPIGGGALYASSTGGGRRHGRYAPAGTPGYHEIQKGPHAGLWTRNRHMNIANGRALRRAIRRGKGFEHMARRMLGFATPHKPKGRMYFKPRARKR